MDALQEALQGGLEGALWVAGGILAAYVGIYAVKSLAKAITSPRF